MDQKLVPDHGMIQDTLGKRCFQKEQSKIKSFFSIWVFFHMTFTIHRTEGKGGGHVSFLSITYTHLINTYTLAG